MALLKFHLKVRSVYQDVSSLAGPDFGLCGAGDALLGFAASLQRLLSGLPCVSVRGPQDSALPGRSASSGTARSLRFLFIRVPQLLAASVAQSCSSCLPCWPPCPVLAVGRRRRGARGPSQRGPLLRGLLVALGACR